MASTCTCGTADLEVTSTFFVGSDSTMFFVDSGNGAFNIAPGDTQTILLRLAPVMPGSLQTSLRIVSTDPLVPFFDVALRGFGTSSMPRITPSAHDFAGVRVGASATQVFELHNDGTVNLTVTSTTIVGADSTLFTVDSGNLPFAMAPFDSHPIFVRFDPDSLGVRNVTLRLLSDDPVRPQLDVPFTGTGVLRPAKSCSLTDRHRLHVPGQSDQSGPSNGCRCGWVPSEAAVRKRARARRV